MKIVIVGLGLIGGSFAKAIKAYTDHTVIGIDRDHAVLQKAVSCGAIDKFGNTEDLGTCDLLIVCLYPEDTIQYLSENAALINPSAVVIDTCGVKRKIYSGLAETITSSPFTFIGAHPMAGKEHSGFDVSTPELFDGASLILTPSGASDSAVELLRDFAKALKFKQTMICTPEIHDQMIAYTSQLPHVLACSYIRDPLAEQHSGYSAGSFQDVTRVATINEALWGDLFLDNRDFLSKEIEELIKNLEIFKTALDGSDIKMLKLLMEKSRMVKEKI